MTGLYKRKDSDTWWMSFFANGRRYRRSTETTDRKMAEKILAKVQTQIVEQKWFDLPHDIKMSEVIDRYMREVSPLLPASHGRNTQVMIHLKKFFGNIKLNDVTASLLSRYKAERLQTVTRKGTLLSPDTVRKELSILRRIFSIAIDEWEYCRSNPVKKVLKSLPPGNKRVRFVLPEEAEKLRFTIPAWLRPIVIVACQTGLRRSNLVRLTKQQVDFNLNRITINRTKNGDPLGIAMTSVVKETLLEVIRERKVISPYIFCDEQGKPYTLDRVSMAFIRACKSAGVENLRLHDLRHDFATLMLRKTKNLVDVQHAMGHKDSRMTMRYAHLMPEDLQDAFDAIDNKGMGGLLSRFGHVSG